MRGQNLMLLFLLLVHKEVKRSLSRDEQQCPEFQLSFYRELLNCHVIVPVISEALVEFSIAS
jgi:hypothetical protein